MAVKSSTVCLLVFVLSQATQHVPCVSARNRPQLPFSGIADGITKGLGVPPARIPFIPVSLSPQPSGRPKLPTVNDVTKGISNALGAPIVNFPAVKYGPSKLPDVSGITSEITNVVVGAPYVNLPGATDLMNSITTALGAPPGSLPSITVLPVLTNGITNPLGSTPVSSGVPGLIPGLNNPLTSIPGLNSPPLSIPGLNSPPLSIPGFSIPGATSSTPSVPTTEQEPGTTIMETLYITSTGLGSTTLTATTHVPPLNEIQIPNFWSFVTKPFSHEPSSNSESPPDGN